MAQPTEVDEGVGLENGDLGLGEGLKPGSLPQRIAKYNITRHQKTSCKEPGDSSAGKQCLPSDFNAEELRAPVQGRSLLHFNRRSNRLSSTSASESDSDTQMLYDSVVSETNEEFPTFADVPFGTSLQQQKRLFEKNMSQFKMRCHSHDSSTKMFQNDTDKPKGTKPIVILYGLYRFLSVW